MRCSALASVRCLRDRGPIEKVLTLSSKGSLAPARSRAGRLAAHQLARRSHKPQSQPPERTARSSKNQAPEEGQMSITLHDHKPMPSGHTPESKRPG